ncbi:MAG: PilZ domain-containing protein [Planctomycetes bacterium]|nr:PilZ domain-containing protein [Planctomycetota bacterium]
MERRAWGRIRAELPTKLVGSGRAEPLRCRVLDVGAGGVFVQAAADTAVDVGQRYEVVLAGESAESSELARFLGNACYATVVRTVRRAGGDTGRIGAGLRFDRPLVFWNSRAPV